MRIVSGEGSTMNFIVYTVPLMKLKWADYVARMEEGRCDFKILTGKHTGKRPMGRPRRR